MQNQLTFNNHGLESVRFWDLLNDGERDLLSEFDIPQEMYEYEILLVSDEDLINGIEQNIVDRIMEEDYAMAEDHSGYENFRNTLTTKVSREILARDFSSARRDIENLLNFIQSFGSIDAILMLLQNGGRVELSEEEFLAIQHIFQSVAVTKRLVGNKYLNAKIQIYPLKMFSEDCILAMTYVSGSISAEDTTGLNLEAPYKLTLVRRTDLD